MADLTRIATLLQTTVEPMAEQIGVTDEQLINRNRDLSEEVTRLRLRVLELEAAVDMDALLPVYNRRAFMREVSRAQSVMSRYGLMSAIIFFDLDGFKQINDRYGHGIGDKILERVAQSLLSGVRQCDMVARLGGDEFGVLLFKCDQQVAKAKAGVLACRIGDIALAHPERLIGIDASWGTSLCDPDDSVETVLDRADRAMYLNKWSN